jgi:hypothetical protein
MQAYRSPVLARRMSTIANRRSLSQFSLDGLLISGLEGCVQYTVFRTLFSWVFSTHLNELSLPGFAGISERLKIKQRELPIFAF